MKTIIALLAIVLAGCAHAPVRKTVTPPMPPGFKFQQSAAPAPAAARFAPASTTPTVTPGTGILQAPELWEDPDPMFGKLFIVRAYQGPSTILTVEWSHSPTGPWNLVSEWSCWPDEQLILVTTSGELQRMFVRGRHTPCTPGFQPASAARLSFVKDFDTKSGPIKAAKIEGHDVAAGFTLWKVLP